MATTTTAGGTAIGGETWVGRWWSAEWWRSPWLDALAFAFGLGAAWRGGWQATDLVWSLWLSSLVVGYSIIVWTIARPVVAVVRGVAREPGAVTPGAALLAGPFVLVGGLAVLAFFTVHFGMFHYVHSQFLAMFFPLDPGTGAHRGFVGASFYVTVLSRYWRFLPAAFLAERGAFFGTTPPSSEPPTTRGLANGGAMLAPYRNVVRMHVLIFFFAFAHFARLDDFAVYAVIYAAYFFPWRVLKRGD